MANPRRMARRRAGGVAMTDKRAVAGRIRKRSEQRLSNYLKCEPQDLGRLKLGTLIHALFLFEGDTEVLPEFNTAMGAPPRTVTYILAMQVKRKHISWTLVLMLVIFSVTLVVEQRPGK